MILHITQTPPWEGEAPAEPDPVVSDQWSVSSKPKAHLGGRGSCRAGSNCQWSVISGQYPVNPRPPREGEAPAEPKSIVTVQLSSFSLPPVARAFLPGRPLAHTNPLPGARLPVALPFHGLIITHKRNLSPLTEPVLAGRSMGFSPCRPPRSRPLQASR